METQNKPLALVLFGHPSVESLNGKTADVAIESAKEKGYEVVRYNAYDFPLVTHIMKDGCPPEFNKAADDLLRADIVIITSPLWHYNITGGLKNVFDGLLQARKHYRFKLIKPLKAGIPIGFLKTRKVVTFYTANGPDWFYSLPIVGTLFLEKQISSAFRMCGVKPWRFVFKRFGDLPNRKESDYEKWFNKVRGTIPNIK